MKYNLIIKPKKFDRFTVVPNYILRHKGISIGATGLYAWLFSHEATQQITIEFICQHFKENQTAIRSKLNELIDKGYLTRKRIYIKGKIAGINYILTAKPKKLKQENLNVENLNLENQAQSNTNNNINKSNTNDSARIILPHFTKLFSVKHRPKTDTQKQKWIDCLDKLNRIDGYSFRDLWLITKFIRQDNFWQDHFLSLLKLRNKDKNDIKYIDKYAVLYRKKTKPNGYNKIKNLKDFYLYTDPNGHERLGAELTTGNLLNEYNLELVLTQNEILEIIKHKRND